MYLYIRIFLSIRMYICMFLSTSFRLPIYSISIYPTSHLNIISTSILGIYHWVYNDSSLYTSDSTLSWLPLAFCLYQYTQYWRVLKKSRLQSLYPEAVSGWLSLWLCLWLWQSTSTPWTLAKCSDDGVAAICQATDRKIVPQRSCWQHFSFSCCCCWSLTR